jgi:hypothetical protein
MLRRTAAATAALALTTAVAPLPLASATTSSKTFTKKANAACAAAGAKIEQLPKMSESNAATVLAAEGDIVAALVKKLKTIKAPEAKASKYKSFVAANQEQATLVDKAIAAAKKKQTSKVETYLKQIAKAGDRSDSLAKSLKLSDCAKSYESGGGGTAA